MADAGLFATARKGGLSNDQCHEIRSHRAGPRPTPYQALARRYGVSEIDIRAVVEPITLAPKTVTPDAWPLGACDAPVKSLIESICAIYGVQPRDLTPNYNNGKPGGENRMKALTACLKAVNAAFPKITMMTMGDIFMRDRSYVSVLMRRARA